MTLVIITGGIDLSVGSVVALAGVIATLLIRDGLHFSVLGWNANLLGGSLEATASTMIASSLVAIAICGFFGLATGVLVTKTRLPAFIVTLSFMLIARGIAKDLTKSESVYQIPEAYTWLGMGISLWDIPNAVVLMFVLYGLAFILMHYTVLGRYLYAVGGNMEAARLSGVPVASVVLFAYVMCGILAGVGGIVEASRAKSGSATFGDMYELKAIAAVVVGGTSIAGGEGRILGTLVGAFMIAVIESGMNQSGIPAEKQPIVLGLVILGAVLLDKLKQWLVRRSNVAAH
jgi:ribose transport system permease protein